MKAKVGSNRGTAYLTGAFRAWIYRTSLTYGKYPASARQIHARKPPRDRDIPTVRTDPSFVFVVACLLGSTVVASEIRVTAASVVKTYSGECSDNFKKFRGSGLLIFTNQQAWVLTSEHVLLHSNGEFCHSIFNPTIGTKAAQLVRADWGMGLALLRVVDPIVPPTVTLDFFRPAGTLPTSAKTWGYPAKSNSLITDDKGHILSWESDRALIPAVPQMVETTGAHGEFGMSGGPVTDFEGNRFVGILSHQYLKPMAGGPGTVKEFESPEVAPEVAEDHLFVIPAAVVNNWLERVFSGRTPLAVRGASESWAGKEVVYSGGLRFEFHRATSATPVLVASGGADGAGTGGSGEVPNTEAGSVQISLDNDEHVTSWKFSNERELWLSRMKTNLLRRNQVVVPYLAEIEPNLNRVRRHYFSTLAQFFHSLAQDSLAPVTWVHSELPSMATRDEIRKVELMTNLKRLQELGGQLKSRVSGSGLAKVEELLDQLILVGDLATTENWDLVNPKWLIHLRDGEADAWKALFNSNYDDTVLILRALILVTDEVPHFRGF